MDTTQAQAATLDELRHVAQTLLPALRPGMLIGLSGPLGAGKTAFVKVLAECFGVQDDVISPTYVYHQSYALPDNAAGIHQLHHLDLYRIHSDETFKALDLAVDDPDSIVLVEWIEQVPRLAAIADLMISFSVQRDVRTLHFDWAKR